MKEYRVIVAPEAEQQIMSYLAYILFVLNSEQAYKSVKGDYYKTLERLKTNAGSIRNPGEPELLERNLKKILFKDHNYVMLFRVTDEDSEMPVAEVVKIFHTLEDYQNKLKDTKPDTTK